MTDKPSGLETESHCIRLFRSNITHSVSIIQKSVRLLGRLKNCPPGGKFLRVILAPRSLHIKTYVSLTMDDFNPPKGSSSVFCLWAVLSLWVPSVVTAVVNFHLITAQSPPSRVSSTRNKETTITTDSQSMHHAFPSRPRGRCRQQPQLAVDAVDFLERHPFKECCKDTDADAPLTGVVAAARESGLAW